MNKTILIVDDDQDSLLVPEKVLSDGGYKILSASSGNECLKMLELNKPDLILLDVMLPDIPGTDVCTTIRNNPEYEGIIIILISGIKITPDDVSFGPEIGADDYLGRPFKKKELLARLDAIFRLKDSLVRRNSEQPYGKLEQNKNARTAFIYEQQSIQKAYPGEFSGLVKKYTEIIEKAIEQRMYKTDRDNSHPTTELAARLGFLKAGARDIIDIHREALHHIVNNNSSKRAFYLKEESRIVLLEVMGYVLNFYRKTG
jgi:DNA-binding response OmpR family regulator